MADEARSAGAPTSKLIDQARAANRTIGKTGQVDDDSLRAIEALKSRLETQFSGDKRPKKPEEKSEAPHSLKGMKWRMVNERPDSSPEYRPDFSDKKEPEKPVDLDKTARECIDDVKQPYLRSLINAAYRTGGSYRSGTPEEINALAILLHNEQMGRNSDYNAEKVIEIAFRALRGNNGRDVSFIGMDAPYPNIKAADTIIANLKDSLRDIKQEDLDKCVAAALSCGNIYAAVDLIQKADQLLTKPGETAVDSAMSRLGGDRGLFQKAREIYGEKLRYRMDGVLASIGEGRFKDLDRSVNAKRLKKEAEERLRKELVGDRDRWYHSQQISMVGIRQKALDDDSISEAISRAALSGQEWSSIDKMLEAQGEKVTDGEVANFIAAELERRLFPELSLERQLDQAKALARGDDYMPGRKPGYFTLNSYEYGFIGHKLLEADMTGKEKAGSIPKMLNETFVEKTLLSGEDQGVKQLVLFLENPDVFKAYMNQVDERWRRGTYHNLNEETFLELKKAMAEKLVAGTTFLQTIAENQTARKMLTEEFGFGEFTSPERLEHSQEVLRSMFSQVLDRESELTIYDEALAKTQGESGEQADEDQRMLEAIDKTIPSEREIIIGEKKTKARELVLKLNDETQNNQSQLTLREEQLKTPLNDQARLEMALESLDRQEKEANEAPVVKFAVQKFTTKGAMTEEEKSAKLKDIGSRRNRWKEELARVNQEIQRLGGAVTDKEKGDLEKKLDGLKRLLEGSKEKAN